MVIYSACVPVLVVNKQYYLMSALGTSVSTGECADLVGADRTGCLYRVGGGASVINKALLKIM